LLASLLDHLAWEALSRIRASSFLIEQSERVPLHVPDFFAGFESVLTTPADLFLDKKSAPTQNRLSWSLGTAE
jgi:hypothetical protein